MVEALGGRPRRKLRAPQLGETLLEAVVIGAGLRIARGNRAARAGIAALEGDVANLEAHDTALAVSEELIFPERGQSFRHSCVPVREARLCAIGCVDFERGAE